LGYGAGTEFWSPRRVNLSLDLVALHVNEESRGWTNDLNLHNQFRLLAGFAPSRAGGRLRIVAGPTVSVLVTQRYDAERGQVYSRVAQNRSLWLDEGDAETRVWAGLVIAWAYVFRGSSRAGGNASAMAGGRVTLKWCFGSSSESPALPACRSA
jgi:hypothetical protein